MGINSFPGRGIERLTDEQRELRELHKQLLTAVAGGFTRINWQTIETTNKNY